MSKDKLEKKILQEKVTRRYEIAIKILMVISIIVTLWIFSSWLEVVHHNDVYFTTGQVTEYSPLNYFSLILKLNGR